MLFVFDILLDDYGVFFLNPCILQNKNNQTLLTANNKMTIRSSTLFLHLKLKPMNITGF